MTLPTLAAARAAIEPYALLLKLAAVALLASLAFGCGWKAGAGLTQGRLERAAAKQAAEYRATVARAREAERASEDHSREVSRDYQQKLADLEIRYRDAVGRIGPVRVQHCPDPARRVSPPTPGAGRPHAADNRPDVPRAAGGDPDRDIGPDLVLLARDADVCRERLTALQSWAALSATE